MIKLEKEIIYYRYKGKDICSLEELNQLYIKYKSVWIVAEKVGGSGQTVHKILSKNGLCRKLKKDFTLVTEFIKENYLNYKNNFRLKEIYEKFEISEITMYRIAKKLGLTSDIKVKMSKELLNKVSNRSRVNGKKYIQENGHPKGFLGHKHTIETRKKISINNKKNWLNPYSKFNSEIFRQNASDRMSKFQNNKVDISKNYTRGKQGYYLKENGERIFMRSSWELNYAIYLDYLVKNKSILSWEYEVDVFWFEKIKRGVRSYKPDFKVKYINGDIEYHEVKGWMDNKSKTKLNRMRIYYPKIKILIIGQKEYNLIKKEYKDVFPDWDTYLNK